MLPSVLLLDPDASGSDDDAQLSLVVQCVGYVRVRVNFGASCDDGSGSLGEDDLEKESFQDGVIVNGRKRLTWEIGLLVLVARVEAGLLELPAKRT